MRWVWTWPGPVRAQPAARHILLPSQPSHHPSLYKTKTENVHTKVIWAKVLFPSHGALWFFSPTRTPPCYPRTGIHFLFLIDLVISFIIKHLPEGGHVNNIYFSHIWMIRMSSMLISRKCKTENTQSDSFQNIMTDVKTYNAESGPEKKKESCCNIE